MTKGVGSSRLRLEHDGREVSLPEAKADLVRLLREWGLHSEPQECIWILAYDSAMSFMTIAEVARGSHLGVELHLPTALAAVLTSGAERFIVVHNHPGGKAVPSAADLALTREVMAAANACGLYFEDHIILASRGGWYSFADHGRIANPNAYAEAWAAAR